MAVRHHDERELSLVHIFRTEMSDRAPVAFITATPGIFGTRVQLRSNSFVADVLVAHTRVDARCLYDILCFPAVAQRLGLSRSGLDSRDACFGFEVRLCSIGVGNDLHLTVGDTIIGKPAETHTMTRVAVDSSDHTVRFFFTHQLGCLVIQCLDILRSHTTTGRLHGYTELGITRHRVSVSRIHCFNCIHNGHNDRVNRSYRNRIAIVWPRRRSRNILVARYEYYAANR